MKPSQQLKKQVQSLKEGDVVIIDTNGSIENREFHVECIEPTEVHVKDGDYHYRVYLRGTGNSRGVGEYVINLEQVDWSERKSSHAPPELFYIDRSSSDAGEEERTEGSITAIR